MKRYIIKSLLCIVVFSLFTINYKPQAVSAHILATDGSIGAVLHIDPDDDPIIGQQASFFFEFKDQTNKFDPKNCTCTFSISENGKQIYSQDLFQNNNNPSLDNSSVFYTFPKQDVYTVKVVGQPLSPNAFKPFTLSWNLRITRTNGSQSNSSNTSTILLPIGIGVVGAIILIGIVYGVTRRKSSIKKS